MLLTMTGPLDPGHHQNWQALTEVAEIGIIRRSRNRGKQQIERAHLQVTALRPGKGQAHFGSFDRLDTGHHRNHMRLQDRSVT